MCFFFFSSRRRHTRCSRDWSSDVCSSDLSPGWRTTRRASSPGTCLSRSAGSSTTATDTPKRRSAGAPWRGDRERGGEGKRGDLGGRRIIKKKKRKNRGRVAQL